MGKTLTSSRHEDITLNSMTQTREKWDSLALSRADSGMLGRCHGIPSFYFLFYCLEATVKKQQFDENDFRHGYGSYFKCAVLKVTWFQLCSQFFLNNYDAQWPRHLKDTLQLKILRTWINVHANSSVVNIIKWKWVKVPWKLSVAQNSEPVLWKTLHQDISLITAFSLPFKQT